MATTATKPKTTKLSIPLEDAVYLAKAILPAISKDDVTPIIVASLWTVQGDKITAIGTDRYRVHRAEIEGDFGKASGSFLIPRKALEWLVKNASHFGRPRQLIVEPLLIVQFSTVTDESAVSPSSGATAAPAGHVSFTIAENGGETPQTLTLVSNLTKGNYPAIVKLIDDAEASEASDPGVVNLSFVSGTRALASFAHENGAMRFVKGTNPNKPGQVLIKFQRGVALIQQPNDAR